MDASAGSYPYVHSYSRFQPPVPWAWVNNVACQVTTLKARPTVPKHPCVSTRPVCPTVMSLWSSDCFIRSSPTCASFLTAPVFPHVCPLPAAWYNHNGKTEVVQRLAKLSGQYNHAISDLFKISIAAGCYNIMTMSYTQTVRKQTHPSIRKERNKRFTVPILAT